MTILKACPFCGAGDTVSEPASKHWTGQRYLVLSWQIRHWCSYKTHAPNLTVSGKDQAEAETRWNTRYPSTVSWSEETGISAEEWVDKQLESVPQKGDEE